MSRIRPLLAGALLSAGVAVAQTSPAPPPAGSDNPPAQAPALTGNMDAQASPAKTSVAAAGTTQNFMKTKWGTEFYGFVELDSIYDSTQSFADLQGNGSVARPGAYGAGNAHHRVQFTPRNSRLGFRFSAPEWNGIRASALAEMDFFGNQPPGSPSSAATAASEAAFFQNPTFRIRHFMFKAETDFVDLMMGQYWDLFGWQSYFHPNSVNLQGLPGQVYSRRPQIRLSHTFKSDAVNFEVAIAAARPPQRDAGLPDGQAGLRLFLNNWKGFHTAGGTGTALDSMAIGVSGTARKFEVPSYPQKGANDVSTSGWGLSIDGLIPIIPATKASHANATTLTASYVRGQGINDFYTGLTGGVSGTGNQTTGYTYTGIDSGLAALDKTGALNAIKWTTYIIGLQYYLPTSNNLWVNGVYSHATSYNDKLYGAAASVWVNQQYVEADLFYDLTKAIRFGLGYMYTRQEYADGIIAENHRVQLSGWFIF